VRHCLFRVGVASECSGGPGAAGAVAGAVVSEWWARDERVMSARWCSVGDAARSARSGFYFPALKLWNSRVCSRRASLPSASGTASLPMSAALGNTTGLAAISGLTCGLLAALGLP